MEVVAGVSFEHLWALPTSEEIDAVIGACILVLPHFPCCHYGYTSCKLLKMLGKTEACIV